MTNSFNLTYNIYRIFCKDENIKDCYVGSTRSFSRRKSQHFTINRYPTRPAYNYKIYKCIRENGGEDNWEMEKLFTFKPTDIIQLREIEILDNDNTWKCDKCHENIAQLKIEEVVSRTLRVIEEN